MDFLFAQFSPEGRMLKGLAQPLGLRLTEQEYRRTLEKGISISGRLEIVSGAERLRVVVRNATSGTMGSVDVPLGPYMRTTRDKGPS
jgi:hypothetical protein